MRRLKQTCQHATVAGASRDRELAVREFGSGAEDLDRKRRSEKLVAAILQDGIMTKGKKTSDLQKLGHGLRLGRAWR